MSDSDQLDKEFAELADAWLTREQMDGRITELGRHLGLDGLALDDAGMAVLEMTDDGMEIVLWHPPDSPALIASAPVGGAETVATPLLTHLLQANMDWGFTLGGTFGMDPDGKQLMLSKVMMVANRTIGQMDTDLAQFLKLARTWRDDILAFIGDDEPDAPEPGDIRA